MAKQKKRGKFSLFRDEQIDAEHAEAMFDAKTAEIGEHLARLEDPEHRVGLLSGVCWMVAHRFKLKRVSEALGLKGDTGASRAFAIARAVEIKNRKPPKGCTSWPEAFEQYSMTALYSALKGRSKQKTARDAALAAVTGLIKKIESLESAENERPGGWFIADFRGWLATVLATGTANFDTLDIRLGDATTAEPTETPADEVAA